MLLVAPHALEGAPPAPLLNVEESPRAGGHVLRGPPATEGVRRHLQLRQAQAVEAAVPDQEE
eukprot:1538848-Pyramimonas_sp.AAC.1